MYSKWLALSLATRQAIAKELGIAKTGSTHVNDNRVVSDGYDIHTVEAALETHEADWDEIVARAEGRMPDIVVPNIIATEESQVMSPQTPPDEPKKKLTTEHLGKKTKARAKTKPKKKGK